MRAHIHAALTALVARDIASARTEVAEARRAAGWSRPVRSVVDLEVALATSTPRETLAEWLAVAATALEGDTLPGDEPYHVAEFLRMEECPGETPPDVDEWCAQHKIIQTEMARVALLTALAMSHD